MRKVGILLMAATMVLAAAAPVAAGGPNVSNTSGSAIVVDGEWYGETTSGHAYFYVDSEYGPGGEFYEESGTYVACDETGENYGFIGTRMYGWTSDATIAVDPKLNHAVVQGTFDVFSETVNDCAGEYDSGKGDATSVPFTASLDGVGSTARFRDSGSYKVPGDYNSHSKQSGRQRDATGSIDLGDSGSRTFDWGMIATISWSDHTNS